MLTPSKLLISLIICGFLVLQGLAATRGKYSPRLWPFLNYPMYQKAHYEAEPLDRFVLFGRLAAGTEVRIEPEDLGLNFFKFERGLVAALRKGQDERVATYVEMYERRTGNELVHLRLENHAVVWTGKEAKPLPPKPIRELRVDSPAAQGTT